LALAVVVSFLGGCGGGSDEPSKAVLTTQTEQTEEQVTTAAPRRGGSDESSEAVTSTQAEESVTTPAPPQAGAGEQPPRPTTRAAAPLPVAKRDQLVMRAADTQAAIGRWDAELAACLGPTGNADDSGATCTHAAWGRLVYQVDVAMYYLLDDLRPMKGGTCHDALAAENDLLRGFWNGAAPLDLAWLDEKQRPPSLFDLDTAVNLLRSVPGRIREAATTLCAP
jgi:hypothetical protein